MYIKYFVFSLWFWPGFCDRFTKGPETPSVIIRKCCHDDEILMGTFCDRVNATNRWHPLFTSETGIQNLQISHRLVIGYPDCGHMQLWPIYHYQSSADKLRLLPNGILRHYFDNQVPNEFDEEEQFVQEQNGLFHDYDFTKYCLDKRIDGLIESEFAWVCNPDHKKVWATNEFLMHNIVSPITHGITLIALVTVAIIFFIMPTLRDLPGNMVTTICTCLIFSQTADLVRLLTVFENHISLLIAETICYLSLLAAFFWLNSMGFYIWITFRTRNVYLRRTDGKKYCLYGGYAWTAAIVLGLLAMFAHFTMDYPDLTHATSDSQRQQIGSLGMIIFFVPVAGTVIADVFFLATTMRAVGKMTTFGTIQSKMRHTLRMFLLLMITTTICWLFFLLSFSKYEGLINSHIIVNSLLGPMIFYICIVNQSHVMFLLKKTCCYEDCFCSCCRPMAVVSDDDGDEMTAMHTTYYYR